MSRIFFSHSSRDSMWAIAVRQWLVEQQPSLAGEIFLDVDPETGIRAGQRWKDALRAANERCEAVVCLVSRNWLGSKECEAEYRAAEYFGKRIYCARIESLDGNEDITREWQRCDLFGPGPWTEVDTGSDSGPVVVRTAGLRQLLDGLRSAGIGADHFPWPPAEDPDRAPYRGWVPFASQDAAVFFGRDGQILHAMDALRTMRTDGTRPMFVVVGASGTGKSSFLRAGLIPRLHRDDRHFVVLDILRPGRNALTGTSGLAEVVHHTRRRFGLPVPGLGDIKTALAEGNTTQLQEWLREIQQAARQRLVDACAEPATLVLPIDQAEELLSSDAGPEGAAMTALLAKLLSGPVGERLSLIVAITIRTDRYQNLQSNPHLAEIGTVLFDDLKPMPRSRFRDIITGPAQRSARHLEVRPDLVDRLLDDCGDGADTLPVLSLTLATLYRDYGTSGELTPAQYTRLGGIDNVVATEVDGLLSRDPVRRTEELAVLRSAFIPFLATIAADGDQPMRRIARWDDLPPGARPLIDRFVERRLLVKDHRNHDGCAETVVEVALESLLRQWHDLAAWLRAEADDLRTAENIERAAEDWQRNNHEIAWMLTGARLIAAETLAQRPGYRERLLPTTDYLNSSREHEDARHADALRRATTHAHALRTRARILTALAAVAVLVAATAGFYYWRAAAAEDNANNLAEAAIATRLLQDAHQQFTAVHDVRRAVLETLAAHKLAPGTATTGLLDAQYRSQNIAKIVDVDSHPAMAVGADGHQVAAVDNAGRTRIWDTTSPAAPPKVLPSTGEHQTGAVAISPDGHWLITGYPAGQVRIQDMTSPGARPRTLPGSGSGVLDINVTAVAVSPDGRWVVAGNAAGGVWIWDAKSATAGPRELRRIGLSAVTSVAVDPDGRWVVAAQQRGLRVRGREFGAFPGQVRMWDTHNDTAPPRILTGTRIGAEQIEAVAVSSDGHWLVTGDDVGATRIWDTTSPSLPSRTLPDVGISPVVAVGVGPDGHRVSAADDAGVVRTWDMRSVVAPPHALPAVGSEQVHEAAVSSDGHWLVTNDSVGGVRIWDARTPVARPRTVSLSDSDRVNAAAIAVSSDGRRVVTGNGSGGVGMWDVRPGAAQPPTLPGVRMTHVTAVAVGSEGKWVAAGDGNGKVGIWDARSPVAQSYTAPGTGTSDVTSVAVGPDGQWVAAGDETGKVRMWDTGSLAEPPRILTGIGTDEVGAIVVSPDGQWLAAGDEAGVVRLWSTDPDQTGVAVAGRGLDDITGLAFDVEHHSIAAISRDGAGHYGFTELPFPAPTRESLCAKLATTMSKNEWEGWVTPDLPRTEVCGGQALSAEGHR